MAVNLVDYLGYENNFMLLVFSQICRRVTTQSAHPAGSKLHPKSLSQVGRGTLNRFGSPSPSLGEGARG